VVGCGASIGYGAATLAWRGRTVSNP
jgi:hypothetical protein